jgi:hypothetical protein
MTGQKVDGVIWPKTRRVIDVWSGDEETYLWGQELHFMLKMIGLHWKTREEEYQSNLNLIKFLLHFFFHTNVDDALGNQNGGRETGQVLSVTRWETIRASTQELTINGKERRELQKTLGHLSGRGMRGPECSEVIFRFLPLKLLT